MARVCDVLPEASEVCISKTNRRGKKERRLPLLESRGE